MQKRIHENKGFSLIEVMITLMLGLIVLLMVVQVFINTKQNHAQNDRVSETLESGRFAMRQLATDLKSAGFYGGVLDPSLVSVDATLGPPTVDCGATGENDWVYNLTSYRALQFSSPGVVANHTCITQGDVYTINGNNSDILTVKRVFGKPLDPTAVPLPLTANTIYLRSDYNGACLWYYDGTNTPGGGNCPGTGVQDWRYMVHVYYIRNHYNAGDGIPTLCRKTLDINAGAPTMDELCLAQGIEAFHIMFGIDTDNPMDGVANEFISDPTPTQLSTRAVSARIYVLARALQPDANAAFTDKKTYNLGDLAYKPSSNNATDTYYRRLYSTTVMLRNPMYASVFN